MFHKRTFTLSNKLKCTAKWSLVNHKVQFSTSSFEIVARRPKHTRSYKFTSKTGKEYIIRSVNSDDRLNVKKFVEETDLKQTEEVLGIITDQEENETAFQKFYPEFYDPKIWSSTKCWICCSVLNPCQIVGAVGLTEEGNGVAQGSFLFVDSNVRSEGIGKQLWNQMIDFVKDVSVEERSKGLTNYKFQVVTTPDIYEESYLYYLRCGFREIESNIHSNFYKVSKLELLV